jgi:hypothetical protein
MYYVTLKDKFPAVGGDVTFIGFASRESAIAYAEKEIQAAKDIGITGVTYEVEHESYLSA